MVLPGAFVADSVDLSPARGALRRREAASRSRADAFSLPRIICPRARGEVDSLKVGVFGGIHGDEPSGSSACHALAAWAGQRPEALAGYELHFYPECNPSGLAAGTRRSRAGLDLNREFWCGSDQPEVRWLEARLREERYHAIISLHEDDTSDGLYGFVGGPRLSAALLDPAFEAAARLLPRNHRPVIDGFASDRGIIREWYPGVLSAPPEQRPRALEIVIETPGSAALELRTEAAVVAVKTILLEYRRSSNACSTTPGPWRGPGRCHEG